MSQMYCPVFARRSLTALCFLLLFTVSARAQYKFDHWTADSALPQNSIGDIQQTRDGYLWLTTFDGLVRFDGVRLTVFNKSNTRGISSNRFLRLQEDKQGDLWASTEDQGGVVRYHDGKFQSYGPEHGLPYSTRIWYMTTDTNGSLLVRLLNNEVFRWDNEKFVPQPQATRTSPVQSGSGTANRRTLCIPSGAEINCYAQEQITIAANPQSHVVRVDAVEDHNGVLWVVFREESLLKVEQGKVTRVYTSRDGLPGRPLLVVSGQRPSVLSKDEQGTVWLTELDTWQRQLVSKPSMVPEVDWSNAFAYEDREGNLWFGTDRQGLFRARKQSVTSYSITDGLTENNVYPIFQDRTGTVWIGTTGGLFHYRDGIFQREEALQKELFTAIGEDAAGRPLVASFYDVWRLEDEHFVKLVRLPGVASTIYGDSDGSIWVGHERGLSHIVDGRLTQSAIIDALANVDIKVVIPDGAGGIWIGAYGGLWHYRDGRIQSWTENDGLPSRTVRALYQDQDGVLWIGTYDGGLGRFKDGKFTRYTTAQGLFNNGVFQILEDRRGNFWLSSNRGVYRVSKQELNEFASGKRSFVTSVAYGKSDGMLSVECNGGRWPAGVKTKDGAMWFPTQDGVAVVNPEAVSTNPQPPPVLVESFLVDRSPVTFNSGVQIQATQENFEISYTALSFINSENIRFKYRLENLDQAWVEAGTRRTAYYSHVPPGRYIFRVIAANSDGVWNTEGASVLVIVRPRYYQTWWFAMLATAGVALVVVLAFRYRVGVLEKRNKQQQAFSRRLIESQEGERKRIATELHDSLGQQLLVMKNWAMLELSVRGADSQSGEALNEISSTASQAIEEVREIIYDLRPYQLDKIGLTNTIRFMVEKVAAASSIKFNLELADVDDLFAYEEEVTFYRIVQECVNNIVKHSEASESRVAIERSEQVINLTIEDNGRGFVQESANEVERGGLGLTGLGERVRMLDGKFSVHSTPGRGTIIRLRIEVHKSKGGEV